jgi:uncharacterized protein with NRDE domain
MGVVCTLAFYFRVLDDYPLLVAANRDEHYDRPAAPPSFWEIEPKIVAGKDLLAGGTWLGANEHGFLVGILNRRSNGAASPRPSYRSRGLLCVDLLSFKTAAAACAFVAAHPDMYQPFTLVFSDLKEAWMAFNEQEKIIPVQLGEGLHVFSSAALHDEHTEKKQRAYQLFTGLTATLNKNLESSSAWIYSLARVLSDHRLGNASSDPKEAICVHSETSGTVSASIVVYSKNPRRVRTFYCAGAPCRNNFSAPIDLNLP